MLFVSVPLPSRRATHHVPFWVKPISRFWLVQLDDVSLRFAYANPSTQPSASTGCDSRYHTRLLTELVYPVRWLHCQYAWHGVVTNPAPYLGYRRLNTGSCQILQSARQLLKRHSPQCRYKACFRTTNILKMSYRGCDPATRSAGTLVDKGLFSSR